MRPKGALHLVRNPYAHIRLIVLAGTILLTLAAFPATTAAESCAYDAGGKTVTATIDALRESGATVLVSTHALAEIEHHVDRVAIVHRGRLLAAGTLAELRGADESPLQFRVRVQPCSTARVLAAVAPLAHCTERDEATLVLRAPASAKMPVLRALASIETVEDVKIETGGLQQLYRRLVERAGETP